jgi:methionyl-tRNA formyltransferase
MNASMVGYRLIADWAEGNGHEIVLVVSPPVASGRRYAETSSLADKLPASASALITGDLRSIAAPVIASLRPDLLISAAFPRLIPEEILVMPKYGALNLHPSVLPVGRGPNPLRLVYEGSETIGATLHRTEKGFDTGAVLSQRQRPLPANLTSDTLLSELVAMMGEVLDEGADRCIDGDAGVSQDETAATHASPFTEAEKLVDLTHDARTIRRKVAALNLLSPQARARVNDVEVTIRGVQEVAVDRVLQPGEIVAEHDDGWTVQAGDRAIRIVSG